MSEIRQIKLIVDYLIDSTLNNVLKWTKSNFIFNSDTRMKYEAFSDDGKTKFEVTLKLNDDFTLSSTSELFTIANDNIIDKRKYISVRDVPNLKKLEKLIYDINVKPNIIIKNQSLVYDNILKSISKEHVRDMKLDKILKK